MPTPIDQALLHTQLFGHTDRDTYAILDGASNPELLKMLWQHEPQHLCLYRGELDAEMAQVAPYLVRLLPDSPFTDEVLKGWGRHWGIFLFTRADLRALRKHFRTFLIVHGPDGQPLYFRYYDPRVLRVFLPTCNAQEAATLFGPVTRYLMEDEDPGAMVRFWFEHGEVGSRRTPLIDAKAE